MPSPQIVKKHCCVFDFNDSSNQNKRKEKGQPHIYTEVREDIFFFKQ